jgi:hypothetical protein
VQKTIEGHAKCPHIARSTGGISVPYLDRDVVGIPTARSVPQDETVRNQSEIADLSLSLRPDEDVTRLEVSMQQITTMERVQTK